MLSPTPASITQTRERLGLSKTDLGRILGVSDSTISKWELGKNRPDENNRKKLSDWIAYTDGLTAKETVNVELDKTLYTDEEVRAMINDAGEKLREVGATYDHLPSKEPVNNLHLQPPIKLERDHYGPFGGVIKPKQPRHIDKWDVFFTLTVTGVLIGLIILLVLIATETV